jgi:hypothetical protein
MMLEVCLAGLWAKPIRIHRLHVQVQFEPGVHSSLSTLVAPKVNLEVSKLAPWAIHVGFDITEWIHSSSAHVPW